MNEGKYENQAVIEYLLGILPAEEAERFDELSFTDDEFADALIVAENNLIDDYLQGKLAGNRLKNFQSFYLASPKRRKKVEFARAFQSYAAKKASEKNENFAVNAAENAPESTGFFQSLKIFKDRSPLFNWGFAFAAILVLFLGGWLIVNLFSRREIPLAKQNAPAPANKSLPAAVNAPPQNSNAAPEIAAVNREIESPPKAVEKVTSNKQITVEPTRSPKQEKPSAIPKPLIASFILLPPQRGDSQLRQIAIAKNTTDVAMHLELEADDFSSYRVVLIDQTGSRNIWFSRPLKSVTRSAGQILSVTFPAKLLKSKIYSLQVSGISDDDAAEIIGDYSFRVMVK